MGETYSSEQLELVIQKKKIADVRNWFHSHFIGSSHAEYVVKCPIIILQGPTGCGKTSVLNCIAKELKLCVKEYSETTDMTAINYGLANTCTEEERENLTHSINSRKAQKFEHFVINSLRYNTLYPPNDLDEAGSEFDSDDEFVHVPGTKPPQLPLTGLIIHVDTPLSFARNQKIIINSLCRLLKTIREVSKNTLRRIAVVFETLEGEGESICLPSKVKTSLQIQTIKFNPVIKTNMKKFVEVSTKSYKHIIFDKDAVEWLVNDCDGDIRACKNTIKMVCNRANNNHVLNGINANIPLNELYPPAVMPLNKKQKISHEKVKHIELKPGLMRANTKSLSFFHVLGKIFYQKRLYPCSNNLYRDQRDRPQTENSTEYLANMVDVEPKNFKAWLHQHYYKFCHNNNIAKAALFLENHSTVDTTTLDSLQTSQFYENHHTIDQLQTHLAIESTVYSLYEDKSNTIFKPSHKKTQANQGSITVKSSVENYVPTSNELYSFTKPVTMILQKTVEDYRTLLDCGTSRLIESTAVCLDPVKVLVDYIPYLNQMCNNWALIQTNYKKNRNDIVSQRSAIFNDDNLCKIFKTLDSFETDCAIDYETRHDQLMEMIEEVEYRQTELTQ